MIAFKLNTDFLIPVIIQDADTSEVLMLAYMDKTALQRTLKEKKTVFFSRSRQKYWIKGETSGHTQKVVEFRLDCEGKSLLFIIEQNVAACHKGYFGCYFDKFQEDGSKVTTDKLIFDPAKVY